jgi:hypothetical protein
MVTPLASLDQPPKAMSPRFFYTLKAFSLLGLSLR